MKLTYTKTVLLSKLHDELLSAGVVMVGRDRIEGKPDDAGLTCSEVYIYIPDDVTQETIERISAIVEKHDPTLPQVYDFPDQEKVALAEAVIDLDARLSQLEAKLNA